MSPTQTPAVREKTMKIDLTEAAGQAAADPSLLRPTDTFVHRHIGPEDREIKEMLGLLGYRTLDELSDATVPAGIRLNRPLKLEGLGEGAGEFEVLQRLRTISAGNKVLRSFIGMGYYDTITPPVILRNIFENPGWYTQYTPYQAEIAQGLSLIHISEPTRLLSN